MTPAIREPDQIPIAFSSDDLERAYEDWGCNCGPAALAACLGWSLSCVHPHLGDFASRRYLNAAAMKRAIESTGHTYATAYNRAEPMWFPVHGLVLIQLQGPWLDAGVPFPARLRHTHWIASKLLVSGNLCVFDVNAGWVSRNEWEWDIVPRLIAATKRATPGWTVNTAWEVRKNQP